MTDTPDPDYSDCPSLHAEANALLTTDRTEREGGTIYVTSHVCYGCAKLIANSGLARVVVETDRADAHRNPLASYQFLLDCGIKVELSDPVMMSRLYKRWLDGTAPVMYPVISKPPSYPTGHKVGDTLIMTYREE